jgi:phosphatidylglycerophosphate synthase
LLGLGDRWLGWPNRLSLVRANLPAVAGADARWAALTALASDVLDGWIARRGGRESGFGGYLDGIADVAFWSWLVWRQERNPWLRGVSLAAWVAPPVGLTIAVFAAGRTLDHPRLVLVRRASVGLQCLAAVRVFRNRGDP